MTRRLAARCGLVVGLAVLLHAGQGVQAESLPPWTPGTLDIHQISTGVGNSALVVFPDGTTLLVDAGDASGSPANVRKPDGTRGAGEWIARYVRHVLQHDGNPAIDYALITHLHGDHLGRITPNSPTGRHGYKLSGLSEVAEFIPIRAAPHTESSCSTIRRNRSRPRVSLVRTSRNEENGLTGHTADIAVDGCAPPARTQA